ncbi:MAG: endonuclease [Alphaproteobacteria bacterium]|jgi:endonuclease/exonuclease/phosphatase family metal-dependent hydrolase|nr:endonuclease [Alphaproteobacteria bacterium]
MIARLLKTLGGLALALLLLACGSHIVNSGDESLPPRPEGALRVATLNVHYIVQSAGDGPWSEQGWHRRKAPLDAAFKAIGADLFALQESETFPATNRDGTNLTLDYLLQRNPGVAAAATGDPADFPSTQPMLYRTDRLTLLDQGWFFFSETPDVIYSRTFDGSWPAFASWAEFQDATGQRVRVVNVHFEYRSRSNRRLSAALVRDRIAPVIDAGTPVLLVGDINAMHGAATMDQLEQAGLSFLHVDGATYHFNRGINLFGAIDHIAHSAGIVPLGDPVVLRRRFGDTWPSDHYPVAADLRLTGP